MYNPEEIEEERRLAYVGITRAKKQLYITTAIQRMLYGQTNRNRPSRFLKEIPLEDIEEKDLTPKPVARPTAAEKKAAIRTDTASGSNRVHVGAKPAAASNVSYTTGERVSHSVFGEGMIVKAQPMGNDTLLEIAFDRVGTKKIMAAFAKLKKL